MAKNSHKRFHSGYHISYCRLLHSILSEQSQQVLGKCKSMVGLCDTTVSTADSLSKYMFNVTHVIHVCITTMNIATEIKLVPKAQQKNETASQTTKIFSELGHCNYKFKWP